MKELNQDGYAGNDQPKARAIEMMKSTGKGKDKEKQDPTGDEQ